MLRKMKKAQGATEYAIFIAAVLAGLLALQVYYSRSVKGNMKGRADSIGEQLNTGDDALYVRESRSVSGRMSTTNTGAEGGAWSRNAVADNGQVDTSFIGGFRSKTATAGSSTGANAASHYASNYKGGELSSTEYVNNQNSWNVTKESSHGVNYIGEAEASGSVWGEADLTSTTP